MQKIIVGLVLLGSLLFSGELHWEKDLKTAFSKAKKENKVVMVMVESESCPWCQKMKKRTLQDRGISKRLKQFILVKIDREQVRDDAIPYAKYVPTIYFMTPKKKILECVTGYFMVLDFNSWIDDVQKKWK